MNPAGIPAWLDIATSETLRTTMAHCAGIHAQRHGEAETARVLLNIIKALERLTERAA